MRFHSAAVAFVLAGGVLAGHGVLGTGADVDGEMPRALLIERPTKNVRVWVDARDVLTEAGEFNEEAFLTDAVAARMVKRVTRAPMVGDCVSLGPTHISRVNPPERESLAAAVRTATIVLVGRVTGRSFGFFGGIAGQLLKLAPEENLKGDGHRRDAVFAFLPVGVFDVGDTRLCKADDRYATPPAVGDRALVFSATPLDARGEILDLVDDGGLLVITRDGAVRLPKRYSKDRQAGASASALLDLARAAARPVDR